MGWIGSDIFVFEMGWVEFSFSNLLIFQWITIIIQLRKSVSSTSQLAEVDDHSEPPSKRAQVDPFVDLPDESSTATNRGITEYVFWSREAGSL